MKKFNCVIQILILIMLQLWIALDLGATEKPNLLVFLADDLGYGDISCFGSQTIKTPCLDKLASQGAKLTSFYAPGASCSPTRVGLLTGRSPFRLGVYTFINKNTDMHLQRSERTLPSLLRDDGYDTCFVGKWGANGGMTDPNQPQPNDHGFDYWFASQNNAGPSHKNPNVFFRNGVAVGEVDGYSSKVIVDEALNWLEQRQEKSKPFCLFVWFHEPHRPVATPAEFETQYEPLGIKPPFVPGQKPHPYNEPSPAAYAGNVAHMDYQIGRLMSALEQNKVSENTLTLFTSDNGPVAPGSAGPLHGGKGTLWEGGIRMPTILSWPAKVKPGQVLDTPIGGLDLLPTVCDIVGVQIPQDRVLDGESFRPLLEGQEFTRKKSQFWWCVVTPDAALRDGPWKLRVNVKRNPNTYGSLTAIYQNAPLDVSSARLFNVVGDIAEQTDVATQNPDVVARLLPELTKRYEEMQAEQRRNVTWNDDVLSPTARGEMNKAQTKAKNKSS